MANKIYEAQIKRSDGTLESADIKTSVTAVEGISAYANLSADNIFSNDNVFSSNLRVGGAINNISIPSVESGTFALVSDVQASVRESALAYTAMIDLSDTWDDSEPIYVREDYFNRTPIAGEVFYCIDSTHLYLMLTRVIKTEVPTVYTGTDYGKYTWWKCYVQSKVALQGSTGATGRTGAAGKPGCSFSLEGTVLTITWNEEEVNKYAVTMTFIPGAVSKAVSTSSNLVTGNKAATNLIITDTVTENDVITITFAAGIIDSPTFIINGTSYTFNDSEAVMGTDFTGLLVCNSSDNIAVLRFTNITANLTLTVSKY